jgi:uncharacterized protein YecT (DUF1311 family)
LNLMRMSTLALLAAVGGITFAAPSFAGANAQPDCKEPVTQSDMNICSNLDWQQADKELNTVYRKAVDFAKDEDKSFADQPELEGALKALKKAQRAWVDYRDGQCEGYGFGARGGSMEPMLVSGCLADLTRKRIHELKELMAYPEDVPEDEVKQ